MPFFQANFFLYDLHYALKSDRLSTTAMRPLIWIIRLSFIAWTCYHIFIIFLKYHPNQLDS